MDKANINYKNTLLLNHQTIQKGNNQKRQWLSFKIFHKTTFKSTFDQTLLTREAMIQLAKSEWRILLYIKEQQSWKQILQNIIESEVKQLMITSNQNYFKIPQIICEINFSHLKVLHMINSNIYNIEAITWLHAPHIQQISLSVNWINRIGCLSKLNFTKIEKLQFDMNPIKAINKLQRMQISTNKNFFGWLHGNYPPMEQDISKFVKFRVENSITQMHDFAKMKINQDKINTMLCKRYLKYGQY